VLGKRHQPTLLHPVNRVLFLWAFVHLYYPRPRKEGKEVEFRKTGGKKEED
jgi:hypothetical protein